MVTLAINHMELCCIQLVVECTYLYAHTINRIQRCCIQLVAEIEQVQHFKNRIKLVVQHKTLTISVLTLTISCIQRNL